MVDRLADPLIGGIHAGEVDELSAAAAFPVLIAATAPVGEPDAPAGRGPAGHPAAAPARRTPVFWSLADGTASWSSPGRGPAGPGCGLRPGTPVEAMERTACHGRAGPLAFGLGPVSGRCDRTRPSGPAPDRLEVDGVILAVPAPGPPAARSPRPDRRGFWPIRYPRWGWSPSRFPWGAVGAPLVGTGFLVPRTSAVGGRPALITGCTYLGRKWPHLARPATAAPGIGRAVRRRPASPPSTTTSSMAAVLAELARLLGVRATRSTPW